MSPTSKTFPVLDRSPLIVPLSSERFMAKAQLRGADGIALEVVRVASAMTAHAERTRAMLAGG